MRTVSVRLLTLSTVTVEPAGSFSPEVTALHNSP
jgi:hypothetical protein